MCIISLFCLWGHWTSARLNNLFVVPWLVRDRAGILILVFGSQTYLRTTVLLYPKISELRTECFGHYKIWVLISEKEFEQKQLSLLLITQFSVRGWWRAGRVLGISVTSISACSGSTQCDRFICILVVRIVMSSIGIPDDSLTASGCWALVSKESVLGTTLVICGDCLAQTPFLTSFGHGVAGTCFNKWDC